MGKLIKADFRRHQDQEEFTRRVIEALLEKQRIAARRRNAWLILGISTAVSFVAVMPFVVEWMMT